MDMNERIDIRIQVENKGQWPLNTTYLDPGPNGVSGLSEVRPGYGVSINATFFDELSIYSDTVPVTELGKKGKLVLNWTIPNAGVIGEMGIRIDLNDGTDLISDGWEDVSKSYDVIITSEPELQLTDISQSKVGVSFDNNVKVQFFNPGNYRVDVVHVTLYNGFSHDGVIISEAIFIGLGPMEFGEVELYFPLAEDRYILTATIETPVVKENGGKMEWLEIGRLESDVAIQKTNVPEEPPDEETDMDDVTTAGIITISATMFVLLVASFFYRREKGEDEEEERKED
jgi:hypothetical protein